MKIRWCSEGGNCRFSIFIVCIVSSILVLSSCQEKVLEVNNPNDYAINDYLVKIDRKEIPIELSGYVSFEKEGKVIPTQFSDTNNDGEWDVVNLLLTMPSNSKTTITFTPTKEQPKVEAQTQVYLGVSEQRDNTFVSMTSHQRPADHVAQNQPYLYQYEGPGWESDKVAFRTYFDSRNGKDIFGKTTDRMVMQEVGLKANYHELQEWGMDILKVGNSLGAGALAMLKGDSLYRLGNTESSEVEVVTNGAVFSELLMKYGGWEVANQTYNLNEKISIYAGQRWYANEIMLAGGTPQDTLVTGIVDLYDLPAKTFTHKDYHVVYTHGAQSYIEDNLGMAIIVASENFYGNGAAPKEGQGITNTHTIYLKSHQGKYRYYFYVGWEKENASFSEEENFVQHVKDAIDQMTAKITINNIQ